VSAYVKARPLPREEGDGKKRQPGPQKRGAFQFTLTELGAKHIEKIDCEMAKSAAANEVA